MTMGLVDQLQQAPDPDDEAPSPARGVRGGRRPATDRARRRAARAPFEEPAGTPFADDSDEPAAGTKRPVVFTGEQAAQLRVLWDEYEQRQRAAIGPKTQHYRCMAAKRDGTLCGAIVEAGTLEERLKTGEVIRCPHGPHAPEAGVMFDRERFPQWHHELTPMEPVL